MTPKLYKAGKSMKLMGASILFGIYENFFESTAFMLASSSYVSLGGPGNPTRFINSGGVL